MKVRTMFSLWEKKIKVKSNAILLRHASAKGEMMFSSKSFLTSALDGGG
jgi:hypothetical protein